MPADGLTNSVILNDENADLQFPCPPGVAPLDGDGLTLVPCLTSASSTHAVVVGWTTAKALVSADLTTWTQVDLPRGKCNALAYGAEHFVAVCDGGILHSP